MKAIFLISVLPISLATSVAAAQSRITFEEFVEAVQKQNLTLKSASAKSEVSKANANGIALPPPMVGLMKMTETWSGSSANGFEVQQMIPFPGKIINDHSARKYQAQAQDEERWGMEAEILSQAKLIYFNLWASQERKNILQERKRVIEDHVRLSRASARSDSFLRVHVLKAESDLDLLENDLLSSDQEIRERQAEAAQVINVDLSAFHPILEEPKSTDLPSEASQTPSHQVEAARLMFESYKSREQEAQSSWFPDLSLRYRETGGTQMMPRLSETMIGVTLPFLFPWEPSAASEKASAQRIQADYEYQKENLKISSEKIVLLSRAQSLRKQIDNLNSKLLPRAAKRMKLVHNLAPRDMETLQDHRETMEAFPELKLKLLELRTQYEKTLADLLKYERGIK